MEEYCRLCSKKSVALINIYSDQGIAQNISGKINSRLQILVQQEDVLPTSVCFNCYGKLDMFDEFVKEAQSSQSFLMKKALEISANATIKREYPIIDLTKRNDDPLADNHVPVIEFHPRETVVLGIPNHEDCLNTLSGLDETEQEKDNNCSIEKEKSACSVNENLKQFENVKNSRFESSDRETLIESKPISHVSFKSRKEKGEIQKNRTSTARRGRNRFKRKYFEEQLPHQADSRTAVERLSVPGVEINNELPTFRNEQRIPKQIKTTKRAQSYQRNEQITRDFTAQAGNTLYSDLKILKNSFLLKNLPLNNAKVYAVDPFSDTENENYPDSRSSKGSQTEMLLGTKHSVTNKTVIYQNSIYLNKSL